MIRRDGLLFRSYPSPYLAPRLAPPRPPRRPFDKRASATASPLSLSLSLSVETAHSRIAIAPLPGIVSPRRIARTHVICWIGRLKGERNQTPRASVLVFKIETANFPRSRASVEMMPSASRGGSTRSMILPRLPSQMGQSDPSRGAILMIRSHFFRPPLRGPAPLLIESVATTILFLLLLLLLLLEVARTSTHCRPRIPRDRFYRAFPRPVGTHGIGSAGARASGPLCSSPFRVG